MINNAGILAFDVILDLLMEVLTSQFNTNFYGSLNMARALVPVIQRNSGGACASQLTGEAIVNVLTVISLASMPGLAAYSASKAADWSMTQSILASVAEKGIAVHAVFPDSVDTDMAADITFDKTSSADVAAAVLAGIEASREEIFPDPMSDQVYAAWRQDHKAIKKQFVAM